MFFKRIESPGLAHYSYVIAEGGDAAVIDPRRDIEVYLDLTERRGYRLRHILETHRHEDFILGSVALAERTGAAIWHADGQLPYRYGSKVADGQQWQLGKFAIEALATPGHTPGSFCYLLRDSNGIPLIVFTGDTFFAGEVGRIDLMGEYYLKTAAGELYESLFHKLLPLGDGVAVCPAHGPGSACGAVFSDRPLTTIGIERQANPRLQYRGRDEFIENVAVMLDRPPYFLDVEPRNLTGAPGTEGLPEVPALSPQEFAEKTRSSFVLDTRLEAFGAAHVPGSVNVWSGRLSKYGGWFLPHDKPLLLVSEDGDIRKVVYELARLGYDEIRGYLSGGMLAWHEAGFDSESVETVIVPSLCHRLDSGADTWVLDVRSPEELERNGKIPGARNIHILGFQSRMDQVPRDRKVYIFCGSGLRSMIAASLLKARGWTNMAVVLGGFAAWASVSCPIAGPAR